MREILFRGKRYKNGEWVYGNLLIKSNDTLSDYLYQIVPISMHEEVSAFDFVLPETLGQFTEMFDKNGKKIFEGDILKGSWETVLTIFYDEISSSYRVKTSTGHEREPSYYGIDKWEIIGNIHDNPELFRTPQNDEVRE